MASKADFTEREWETLHKGVMGAGLLMSLSDRSFFDTFKEAGALGRHLARARSDSPSELVRELAETGGGMPFGVTASPGEVESETLEALRTAISTLESKAPDEVEAYRTFVVDVAQSVAGAAEGGGETETGALERIRSALAAASAS